MRVLLAIDSSVASQTVIDEAVSLPWQPGTVFCVMTVVDMGRWEGLPELIEDAKHEAENLLTNATAKLRESGCEILSEVQTGLPKKAIPEFARQWESDLVMVGSRGLSALPRFLLGSVAQAVLRFSPCSVEIVRRTPRSLAPRGPMKILLGTDGSEASTKAAFFVAKRAWPVGSMVQVICVRDFFLPEKLLSCIPICPKNLMNEIFQTVRTEAESTVAGAQTILSKAGLRLSDRPQEMPVGDPRSILLDEADAWRADLIVVGSHGRHGFDRLVLGSVSESIALHAHCSVEIIRG